MVDMTSYPLTEPYGFMCTAHIRSHVINTNHDLFTWVPSTRTWMRTMKYHVHSWLRSTHSLTTKYSQRVELCGTIIIWYTDDCQVCKDNKTNFFRRLEYNTVNYPVIRVKASAEKISRFRHVQSVPLYDIVYPQSNDSVLSAWCVMWTRSNENTESVYESAHSRVKIHRRLL